MSRSGKVTLGWADGEYAFRLGWAQLGAVQEACDAGPAWVLNRLHSGEYRTHDIEAPIFQGLLGGGMEPAQARKLVRLYVHEQPLAENVLVARAILAAAIVGVEDEPPDLGKPRAAAGTTSPLSPEGS